MRIYFCVCFIAVRDWSLIMGRGGGGNGKIVGLKLFAPPPPRQGNTFRAPLLRVETFHVPPLQYG